MATVWKILIWIGLGLLLLVPLLVAAFSPLLAYREAIYILAGFAGVAAMGFLLLQPLLAGGYLPGLPIHSGRRVHRIIGACLLICVVLHVGALWITSPPDVIDALLLVSPTPFSIWGVIAMWGIFATACLALIRRRLRLRMWRLLHSGLAVLIVLGSVIHAMLIEGTMGTISKTVLCVAVLAATLKVLINLGVWRVFRRS